MDPEANATEVTTQEPVDVHITLINILDYIGDAVRPLREGSIVYESHHVMCIGYRKKDPQCLFLTGYVTQSSHPNNTPHEVTLHITPELSDWKLRCSCKAGTNRCKHIIACLLHLERTSSVEYMSCTDAVQAWGHAKSKKNTPWGARRIAELCCVKEPVRLAQDLSSTDEETKVQIVAECFNNILKVSKTSAIFKHRAGRFLNPRPPQLSRVFQAGTQDRNEFCIMGEILDMITCHSPRASIPVCPAPFQSPEERNYYNANIAMSESKIAEVAVETREQGSNVWKIHRAKRITASSCYKLYTYLKNSNPKWDKKIANYWNVSNFKSDAMRYGTATECKAFECYKRMRNPLMKKCGLVIKKDECWFAASPDGVDPDGRVVLEIKCPTSGEHGTLEEILASDAVKRYTKRCNTTGILSLNEHHAYYCQVQLNMYCLQCVICDFVIYSCKDDDFILIEISFNPLFVENVINGLKGLYFTKMLAHLLPTTENQTKST